MGILVLKSSNPNFSYVIFKNPLNGMISKSLRKGTSYGWYGSDDTYLVYFKDSYNNVSYSKNDKEDFEYNDLSRYNSPLFILNVISEYFSSVYKKVSDFDTDGFSHSISFNLEIQRLNLIKNMFYRSNEFIINYDSLGGNNYNVTISTSSSLNKLFNFLNVFALFIAIVDGYWVNMTDEMLKKYVKSLNEINANYYMRYLFKLKAIYSNKMFQNVKSDLENYSEHRLELLYGNTADWRRDFVYKHLDFKNDILDVGCGEGFYSLPLAKKMKDNLIHSIDIDENCLNIVSSKAESRGLSNLLTYISLDNYLSLNNSSNIVDIILVEVIEHMEKDDSKKLIKELLRLNFNKFFITSPVQEFNVHYDLDNSFDDNVKNGFRHPDHKWEGTVDEFTCLISECIDEISALDNISYEYNHYMIGDLVDGIAPTQGVVITKSV